jgi:predicted aspartyl protease
MQKLDIQELLLSGGVPREVVSLTAGSRKLEIDLHVADQNGHFGPSIRVDNLCIVQKGSGAKNWNEDEGLIDVEWDD